MARLRFSLIPLVPVALGLIAGCTQPDPLPDDPPNVVLVLIDTLRADHMSLYGYERETTPGLDALAAGGAVFEQARSQAACTFPSANVIFTSTPMMTFLGRTSEDEGGVMGIPPQLPTIAQIFQQAGYRTAAVSASPIVRNTPDQHNPDGGFGAGFEVFDESCTWKKGDCVIDQANEWLAEGDDPYFLYLHFMEPHGFYQPETRHFTGEYKGENPWIDRGDPNPIIDQVHGDGREVQWTDGDLQHLKNLYDDEIRSLDARLTPFLERLMGDGKTLVSLVSDHGESFLEKENVGHCRSVWDTEVKIPLVFLGPGVPAARIPHSVEAMDLAPTLLQLAGFEAPATFHGRNLAPLLRRPDAEAETSAMSQAARWRSLAQGRYKLVDLRDHRGQRVSRQLFDVLADPQEQHDLIAEKPEVAQKLIEIFVERQRIARGSRNAAEADRQLDEHVEQLRALGYLE